ncbi:MAG: ROK family protein [Bacteroidales bacterium]|jgi:glucokinase|nr:ROK family protein [Bacteroidales bacterium]
MKTLFSIGIDIGGTNTDMGLVNRAGQCFARTRLSTAAYFDANRYVDDLVSTIGQFQEENGIKELQGIGIGAPNANYYTGCIESATNLNFKDSFPIRRMLQDKLHLPVEITNDANAAAYGEMIYGGAQGMKHFIMVTLGTGVGSGFVVDGHLVYGHDGYAGELGHTIVFPEGRMCNCGRRGCLEQYVAARGITQTCLEMMSRAPYSGALTKYEMNELGCRAIANEANAGDKVAQEVFEYTGHLLGVALANAVTFSSPEAIFLTGGIMQAGDLLLNPLKHSFEDNLLFIYKNKVKLRCSELPFNDASILGAAALVF